MVICKKIDGEYKHVLSCDKSLPVAEQTVFYYRLPSLEQQYDVINDMEYEQSESGKLKAKITLNKKGEVETLISCITRIDNLKDEDGKGVNWPGDEPGRRKVLATLAGEWRVELINVIRGGGNLSEEEAKN